MDPAALLKPVVELPHHEVDKAGPEVAEVGAEVGVGLDPSFQRKALCPRP